MSQTPIDGFDKSGLHRGLDKRYSTEQLDSLEAKCSKMILDCVAWDRKGLDFAEIGKMYDMLYSLYCAKLSDEGQEFNRERDIRSWIRETHRSRNDSKPNSK